MAKRKQDAAVRPVPGEVRSRKAREKKKGKGKGKEKEKKEGFVRGVTFAVATVEGGTWQEFICELHKIMRATTAASNWAMRRYAQLDDIGTGAGPLPPCPDINAYQEVSKAFPDLPTGTAADIAKHTLDRYRGTRTAVYHGRQAMDLFRYPAPVPIRAEDYTPVWVYGERPGICFVTGRLGDPDLPKRPKNWTCPHCQRGSKLKHWTIVMAGGDPFRRQTGQFAQMMEHKAEQLSAAILLQRCGNTHRGQTSLKHAGGGERVPYRPMVKLVMRFPPPPPRKVDGCVNLRTDAQALWVAQHDGRVVSPWVINGDEAKSRLDCMQAAHYDHAARLQRLRQDLKVERRTHVGRRQQWRDAMARLSCKHKRALKTFIDQSAAGIVGYCVRQHVATLLYDDTERGWSESFPWFALRLALKTRCEAAGIAAGGALEGNDSPDEVAAALAAEGMSDE